jgi:pyrroloquinoline quinone biosynthesis protein E
VTGPTTLIAELTYACPLRCAYCSNPVAPSCGPSLTTDDWTRVIGAAEALGVVQLHLTGGEPLLRPDLEAIVAAARARDLYIHLVTSGVPLTRDRLARLVEAGLDAVQLSFQGAAGSPRIAGVDRHQQKLAAAAWVRELDLPLTVNVVLHAGNIDEVPAIIPMARSLGAHRLELASTQYLGWALVNRAALLPSRAQIARARRAARAAVGDDLEILFVLPDLDAGEPRACMGGWGRGYLVVAPDGLAMPCHAARDLPIELWHVRDHALADIWRDCPGFLAFRGEDWMQEPCRSCERRAVDFAGCRCQAFAMTGDPRAADPACARNPRHDLVRLARAEAPRPIQLRQLR